MIHFFLTFSDDASDSPFAHALRDLKVDHRIISAKVLLRYRRRIWLILVGLPRLMFVALRAAWQSLVTMRPVPDAVVVNSHFEVLAFRLVRWLARRDTRISYLGFIFTRRSNAMLDRLRRKYFEFVFRGTDRIFCYSALERRKNDELFPSARGKFAFVPYGLHFHGYENPPPIDSPGNAAALSAGRSGRDYRTLFDVFARTGLPLRVICDSEQALAGCRRADNIEVLRECYDDDYSRELRQAGMVIVPLAVDDISAGQMVVLQAMANRKPIVATKTATISDYLTDAHDAILVPMGDSASLERAIRMLHEDEAMASRLATNAYETYVNRHSMKAFVKGLVEVMRQPATSA